MEYKSLCSKPNTFILTARLLNCQINSADLSDHQQEWSQPFLLWLNRNTLQ